MAALIAMLAAMSILLSALLPVWQHEMRREKEEELVFRGEQYARAIHLFQRRYPGTYPPNLDVLVEQKFLRKKYKDPITGDDFQPLRVGQLAQLGQAGQQVGSPQAGNPPGGAQPQRPGAGTSSQLPQGAGALGGIIGVTSGSSDDSIRIYKGRTKYNQWPFVYAGAAGGPGGPGQRRPGAPGTPGAPGSGPAPGPRPITPNPPR
jgi:type II secretory pathway pseudopilin PulG